MELMRDSAGDPISPLLSELSGKQLSLLPSPSGTHLFQAIPSRWREVEGSLKKLIDELDGFRFATDPDGLAAIDAFRRLAYDATELFDVYAQLLPAILGKSAPRADLKSYADVAKRLRAPWALICNKCKHSGSQIVFVWATSTVNGAKSARYMVASYQDGAALLRDEQVHKGRQSGLCLTRSAKELAHALLRVDLQARKLARAVESDTSEPLPTIGGAIQIGKELARLEPLQALAFSNEPTMFDSFRLEPTKIVLDRATAGRLINPLSIRSTLRVDGVTKIFSFA